MLNYIFEYTDLKDWWNLEMMFRMLVTTYLILQNIISKIKNYSNKHLHKMFSWNTQIPWSQHQFILGATTFILIGFSKQIIEKERNSESCFQMPFVLTEDYGYMNWTPHLHMLMTHTGFALYFVTWTVVHILKHK